MKFLLTLFMVLPCAAAFADLPTFPVNLDFESGSVAGAHPTGWGGGGDGYQIVSDSTEPHGGSWSAAILAGPNHSDFGALTQCIGPENFLGGYVQYSGYLKTSNVTNGWAGLWMRVDGQNGTVLAFDNMQDRGVVDTVDWTEVSISLPVGATATRICFGALLKGDGVVWIDDLLFNLRSGRS